MSKHISRKQKSTIVGFYKTKPMTLEFLAGKFNISVPSVIKILNEYKIKRYTKAKLFSPDLDEHYFKNIDTEVKAYFLGLIITDGCVHNTRGKQSLVSLTLQNRDSYILEAFKKEIKSNKKITHDGRGCSEINILSDIMVNNLKKYGVKERKSLKTIFPENIPLNLYPHLIRGMFDGDGSISYYARPKKKAHVKAIRFCQGNEKFLLDMVDFLYKQVGVIKVHTYKEKENLWSIAYRKDISIIKMIDYMYTGATIYIKRKKKLCDLIYPECYRYVYGNTEITKGSNEPLES